jgi:DNA-binding transcriptional MerR regulator
MTAGEGRRKAPDAFRTIGEAAAELGVATHVLRFWEGKFPGLKPMKRAGNRRYYRPADMAVLGQIKRLLRDEGYTIKGAQKALLSPGDIEVSEAEQSTPTLFDSVPETLENPTSETASRPLESLRTEQLRGLAMEAERLAAECAIVAAGNRPPTSMD